jgi:hypothetical protein
VADNGEAKNFNDESLFPNLRKLATIVLTLPHSNAEAERIFSMVSNIKIKKSNRGRNIEWNVRYS